MVVPLHYVRDRFALAQRVNPTLFQIQIETLLAIKTEYAVHIIERLQHHRMPKDLDSIQKLVCRSKMLFLVSPDATAEKAGAAPQDGHVGKMMYELRGGKT